MTKRILIGALAGMLFVCGCAASGGPAGPSAERKACSRDAKVLRHVVLFAFKEGTSPEQVRVIEDAFRELPSKIEAIADFEYGTDISPEGKAQGFTHCFLVTFRDQAGRDAYLPHAAHQEFVKVLRPHLEKVLVVDYWAKQ
jgi:hypothetical protein